MSDGIPHPSHRSTVSWSAGGLGECWSHPSGPTLSVDVENPFEPPFGRRPLRYGRAAAGPWWSIQRGFGR